MTNQLWELMAGHIGAAITAVKHFAKKFLLTSFAKEKGDDNDVVHSWINMGGGIRCEIAHIPTLPGWHPPIHGFVVSTPYT